MHKILCSSLFCIHGKLLGFFTTLPVKMQIRADRSLPGFALKKMYSSEYGQSVSGGHYKSATLRIS